MGDTSFDIEELEYDIAQKTITAWSSQVAPKVKGRRTYSRRVSAFSQSARQTEQEPSECPSPPERTLLTRQSSLPTFKLDTSSIPGRRRFTRASSVNDVDDGTQTKPPSLLRSVSTGSAVSSTHRSSSISSSISSFGEENIDPNFESFSDNLSPKRATRSNGSSRGRKKVRSAKSYGTRGKNLMKEVPLSSFSNLAKVGEDGLSWAKPSSESSPLPSRVANKQEIDYPDFLESSPAGSSVGSLRKRGIWESPLDDYDDNISMDACSTSRPNKLRSRSQVLCTPLNRPSNPSVRFTEDSRNLSSDFMFPSTENNKKRDLEFHSDDGESGYDTEDRINSGDDASVESFGNARSPMPTFVPFSQKQKRRATTFNGAHYGSSQVLTPKTADVDDIIESMSSYSDLRFLVKSMRKESSSANRQSWMVALPVSWVASRRSKFVQWTTRSLGFSFRSGGMSVTYIQISKMKGNALLQLLESATSACKERGLGTKTPANVVGDKQHFDFSCMQNAHQPSSVTRTLTLTPNE